MSIPEEPVLPPAANGHSWLCCVGLVLFSAAVVYVLSFGPAFTLSTTQKCAGYDRPALCPRLAATVNAVYHPLFLVLAGGAGSTPRDALARYVHLCDLREYGAAPWETDMNKVESSVNEAVEKLKARLRESH
jgi:hypothetical protein